MEKKLWKLAEITQKDVLGLGTPPYQVAVIPFGSTEPHNYHLPYGSDHFEADHIADAICSKAWQKGARVVQLPAIPYGVDWNMIKFPMAIHVSPSTHLAILRDILKSLKVHGIMKIVILNSHGGNEFRGHIRELHAETDQFICLVEWWKCCQDKAREIFSTQGDHGGQMETSVCLHFFPELVQMKDAGRGATKKSRFKAIEKGSVWISRPWHLLTENSGHGNPAGATAEKGKRYIQAVTEEIARFIAELSPAEMDGNFPY
jgi:creatinine amidohydrolase